MVLLYRVITSSYMLSQIMLLSAAVWSQLLSLFHSLASSINFTCAEVLRRI